MSQQTSSGSVSNVVPFNKQETTINKALALFEDMQELWPIESKPESVPAIIFMAVWRIILAIKNSTLENVETKIGEQLNTLNDLSEVLSVEPFNNPTFDELRALAKNFLEQENFASQLGEANIQNQRLLGDSEQQQKLIGELQNEISRLNVEARNLPQRLITEINDPNSKIHQAVNRVYNSVKSIENARIGLSASENSLTESLSEFSSNFKSTWVEPTPADQPVVTQSTDWLRREVRKLELRKRDLEAIMFKNDRQMGRAVQRIERFQTMLKAKKPIGGRMTKAQLAYECQKAYGEQLREVGASIDARLSVCKQVVAATEMILNTKVDKNYILPEIPAGKIDISLLSRIVDVNASPVSEKAKSSGLPEDMNQFFLDSLAIPHQKFLEVSEATGLGVDEILVCSLYELIPGDYEKHNAPVRSLRSVLWAAAKTGILQDSKYVVTNHLASWIGSKDVVYGRHSKIRPYLEYKPMGMPRLQRTFTTLPWGVIDLIGYDQKVAFQRYLREKSEV